MAVRKSEGCIVPQKPEDQSGGMKPGNSGEGKAAERLSQVGQGIARTQSRIRDDNRTDLAERSNLRCGKVTVGSRMR